jgi:hypothetical protein
MLTEQRLRRHAWTQYATNADGDKKFKNNKRGEKQ